MHRAESPLLPLRRLLWGLSIVVALLCGSVARADDLAAFEAARALYERQNYGEAVDALRELVGTDPPKVSDPLLALESRKYLAAALLFMGAAEDAKTQFRMLLAQEPRYTLDPLAFPTEVLALFERVKSEIQRDLDEKRRAAEAAQLERERSAALAAAIRKENLARLKVLAEQAEERDKNSRWIASLPFGVGQFQNGHKGLGVALAMVQGLSAATSILSFVAHGRQADDRPSPGELDAARREERIWRKTNYASFGIFAGFALIGILDAHVRFVPERVTSRPRQLPQDLDRWVREQGLSSGGPALRF